MLVTSIEYHEETSYQRRNMKGHFLDQKNRPDVFKTYPGAELQKLPRKIEFPEIKLSTLIKKDPHQDKTSRTPDIEDLSRILILTYSFTAKAGYTGGDFFYRSCPSAGALYPVEIYLAGNGINGLKDGLYHFSIAQHALAFLRKDHFPTYAKKAAQPSSPKSSPMTFFFTAIFFRSAWKYRDRSYRYHLLDTGHLLENLLMALKSNGLYPSLSYDFDDYNINQLLGLDVTKEVCLCLCQVQGERELQEEAPLEIDELPERFKNASRVAKDETDYPFVREMHMAGSTVTLRSKTEHKMLHEFCVQPDRWEKIKTPASWPEVMNYPESVFQRRSSRNFVREPITREALTALLDSLRAQSPGNTGETSKISRYICIGFLIGRAEGFARGFYLLNTESRSIGMAASGLFPDRMARACLDQAWLANAAVHFLFMTNLKVLDQLWGPRGYRYAMMTAGRMGERLYLATTAMGLGCCGIGAFYDMEAADLLVLNKESRLLYLVAAGPVKSGIKR
jgi:SagB-type dehydrogenase family enzyme